MANESFQKNSLGWQLQLLQKRLGEWWELQTSRINVDPDTDLSWLDSELLKGIFWLLVLALTGWSIWQLIKIFAPYIYGWTQQWRVSEQAMVSSPVEFSVKDWVERSQKFQAQENYQEACLCLYQATLQQLHNRELASQDPSRTDGEYLQITQNLVPEVPYQVLFNAHQQICFSQEKASYSLFERCQQAWREIANG